MEPRQGVVYSAALVAALLVLPAAGASARARDRGPDPVGAEAEALVQPEEGVLAVAPADDPEVTPADDAYHYAAWADDQFDGFYSEWWYFNFHNPLTGVRAIFSYFVADPEDIRDNAQAQMVAVAYTPDGTVKEIDPYTIFEFTASDQQADVHIGANAVSVGPDGKYHLTGASLDGRLAWDLVYNPRVRPWFAADRMHVGSLDWESMSWLVQMPRALVTGTLTVDGVVNKISAIGYHDHNWGEWIPTDALWNWAQFSSPRLSIEVGDFIGDPVGLLALTMDGVRTVFTPDQYKLVTTRWKWDPENGVYYPKESRLTADNGSLRFVIHIRAWQTEALRGDLPWPLKDLIIYEQTARFQGRVFKWKPPEDPTAGEGQWVVTATIGGMGFKEWTWKRY